VWLSSGKILRAQVLAELGKTAQGLTLARDGMAEKKAQGSLLNQPFFLALLAHSCQRAGQWEESLDLLADALETSESTGERWFAAELHRLRGSSLLAYRPEEHDEAEACFHQAIAIARKQAANIFELRAAVNLAQLWRDQGKWEAATNLLGPIKNSFTDCLDFPDLNDAHAMLDGLR
jgi:predicted ATPase